VVSLLSGVRDARALPTSEIFDTYFDCQLNEVGFRILSCGGHVYTQGQQSGAYRLREWTHCDTGAYSYQWYAWNGSGWTAIAGPPQASC
jgi:hypothetical protein